MRHRVLSRVILRFYISNVDTLVRVYILQMFSLLDGSALLLLCNALHRFFICLEGIS